MSAGGRAHGFKRAPLFLDRDAMRAGPLLALLIAVLTLSAAAAAATPAADRLVLQPEEAAGLETAPSGLGAARRDILRLAPRRPLRIESAVYRSGGTRLSIRAARLRTAAQAGRTLLAWRAAARAARTRARPFPGLGTPAFVTVRRRGAGTETRVAMRVGDAIAVLEHRSPLPRSRTRRVVAALAAAEVRRLRAVVERTAWDRALLGIRPDGTIPTTTLLQLTSMLYGPIDGVRLPEGGPGVDPQDGTWVLEQLRIRGPQLTPQVRAAVERALRGRSPRRPSGPGRARRAFEGGCRIVVGGRPLDVGLSNRARELRDAITARIPGYGAGTWHTCVYRANDRRVTASADTLPWKTALDDDPFDLGFFGAGLAGLRGTFDMCHVRVQPRFFANSAQNQTWALAHEMYHCARQESNGQLALDTPAPPAWAEEGLADWAAHQVAPGSVTPADDLPGNHFTKYLQTTDRPLFTLSYHAFGFFGRVEEAIGAPALWQRVVSVWNARDDSYAAWSGVTGFDEARILRDWGSGLWREPAWPAGWFQQRPFAVTVPPAVGTVLAPSAPGVPVYSEVTDHRARIVLGVSPLPVVRVWSNGSARITDGRTSYEDPFDQWFCFGGGCRCPAGQVEVRPIPPHVDLPDGLLRAGLAAGGGSSRVWMEGHSLEEYCQREDREPPVTPGGPVPPGGGGSNGDPHIESYDGQRYGFQAAGEFVLTRGPGIEVQARQEPWRDSRIVSINTMIAMEVGPARVVVTPGDPLRVDTGGGPRVLRRPVRLQGGGLVEPGTLGGTCSDVIVRWPNGAVACLWSVAEWGVAIRVVPPEALRGRLVGILGDFDGDPADDYRTRAGRVVDPALMRGLGRAAIRNLYGVFGDSWRVRQGESLMRYRRGETTGTFTRPGFPSLIFTTRNLTAAQRAAAEQICRSAGVTDPELLEDCILDVAVTGLASFAEAMAVEQRLAIPPPVVLGTGDNPWVLVDRAGTTHVVWRRSQGGRDDVLYRRRPAGAADFEPERVLPTTGPEATADFTGPVVYQEPAPSDRVVVLASRCCSGPGTFALTSTDGGAGWSAAAAVFEGPFDSGPGNGRQNIAAPAAAGTWIVSGAGRRIVQLPPALSAPPLIASTAQPGAGDAFDSGVAAGPDGVPVMAWTDLADGFVRAGVGGPVQSLGPQRTIDVAGGAAGVVVLSTANAAGRNRVEARRFVGGALGAPVGVSAASDRDPVFPYLGTDAAGRYHAVWVSTTRDLMHSRSADGVTWSAPRALAYAPEDIGIFDPVVSAGGDGAGWTVWDQNRTGTVFAAPVPAG